MNIFDTMSQQYDAPHRVALAKIINKKIQDSAGDLTGKTVMDYGCGTGLIGLPLAEKAEKLLLVDPSSKMIEVTQNKIQKTKVKNANAKVGTTESLDVKSSSDLIVMSLVMLQVPDTKELLTGLYQALKTNGRLLIVDFDKNPNVYHERVHNGFEHNRLKTLAEEIGFRNISIDNFYHGSKIFMQQDATIFLFSGEKVY
uniref:class I SAM-dependent methyltransferase n=1 Tax=Enterococcus faecalis TaxID=1351 RepID=UPI0004205C25|nr:methyltransferase domain-containing protein [Enterococcus faecalis]